MAESNDNIYVGTFLKFILEIKCDGFDMDEDEFEIELHRGPNTISLTKGDCQIGESGWIVVFDSRELGSGKVTAKVTAHVPDNDFPGGIRDEVAKFDLLNLKF